MEYKVNDLVEKVGGDYEYKGTVVAAFFKASGTIRYVVEDSRGMLFIFNESGLKPSEPAEE